MLANKDTIVSYRNKAIALFRAQSINELVENLQVLNKEDNQIRKDLANIAKRTEELNAGLWIAPMNQLDSGKTPEELKTQALEALAKDKEALEKALEASDKRISEKEAEIVKAENGESPYRYDRCRITQMSDQLMEKDASTFELPSKEPKAF